MDTPFEFPRQLDALSDYNLEQRILRTVGIPKRVSTQFDKTDTTLTDVTGLSVGVEPFRAYTFEAILFVDASLVGGSKYSIGGTCTATAIKFQTSLLDNTTNAYTITSRSVALANPSGQAGTQSGYCVITGTIQVATGGTLTVQFAQNAANGTSSVLKESSFFVRPCP